MKGISFVTDEKGARVAVQIDLQLLQKHQEDVQDFLDVIIAEHRSNDESVSWEIAMQELKAAGKL